MVSVHRLLVLTKQDWKYLANMNHLAMHGQQCGTVAENVQQNIVVSVASLISLGGEATGRFAS